MEYCCNYDYVKDNHKREVRANSCFSGIYNSILTCTEFGIYVLKSYSGHSQDIYKGQNNCSFTEAEVEKYIKLLQKIGFKLKVDLDAKCSLNAQNKNLDAYYISWKPGENSKISNLILMNAIRYLYENPYQQIVEAFLHLAKYRMSTVSMWNRFLMAHNNVSPTAGTGHMIRGMYGIEKPMTEAQFETKILKNATNLGSVQGNIPTTSRGIPMQEKDELRKMLQNKQILKDIYTKYQEICVKYS